jgi:transcriptional regulator with GAF, ATPase, and Fis domain
MEIRCWAHFAENAAEPFAKAISKHLEKEGVTIAPFGGGEKPPLGLIFVLDLGVGLPDVLSAAVADGSKQIVVVVGAKALAAGITAWDLLASGATDVLILSDPVKIARQIRARFERWLRIEELLQPEDDRFVLGNSTAWRAALRRVVEAAGFSDSAILILGESGTGKEVVAKLIHQMDARPAKRDFVVQDCSTLVADLSGSEFFGHERGAFTGASTDRQGAFALANGGTLFLDEIGELPLLIQPQLLRAIQEGTFKRVGGSSWQRSNFRLICATNRDLEAMVAHGGFRADLFHRIAGHVCRLPPLRERLDDVLSLAQYFIRRMKPDFQTPTLDPMVRDYLIQRDYPGNVRELKQVVARLMNRCAGDGTISIGYVPPEERPARSAETLVWLDAGFEAMIQRAVLMGAGLKEIGRAAEDCAIRCATKVEDGSLKRAAQRLGVTDRALQMRRAHVRSVGVHPMRHREFMPR